MHFFTLLMIGVFTGSVAAQVTSVTLNPGDPDHPSVTIKLDKDLDLTACPVNRATMTSISIPALLADLIRQGGGSRRVIQVFLNGPVPGEARTFEISISGLCFADGTRFPAGPLAGIVLNSESVKTIRENVLRALKENAPEEQKQFLISGFGSAGTGASQGTIDLALNPELRIPNLTSFIHLKQNTAEGADPKAFDAGFNYRQAIYAGSRAGRELGQIYEDVTKGRRNADQALVEKVKGLQTGMSSSPLAAHYIDIGGKLEGDTARFSVMNSIGEAAYSFTTKSAPILKIPGAQGSLWLLPFGWEGGSNRSKGREDANISAGNSRFRNVDWIARYKAGTEITLRFDRAGRAIPIVDRLRISATAVARRLFFDEVVVEPGSDTPRNVTKGWQYWTQIGGKLYVGETKTLRYGVKVFYQLGALPPVYSFVRTTQFGILLESKSGGR